jgi:hypothetical protein
MATERLEAIRATRQTGPSIDDFEAFCGLVDIVPKGGGRCKLVWNEIQRRYCANRTQRDVSLKARQAGFTTLEQARDVWHFLTVPGARVVVTCQSITDRSPVRLLSANYRLMFESLQAAGVPIKFRTESISEWVLDDRDASLRIIEAGASEAAAQKKGRAGTITRLHLTETAFYEYAEETLNALLECVPGIEYGSEIISESTPNGAQGVFYRQCKSAEAGESGYKLHFFPWFLISEYSAPLERGERIEPRDELEERLLAAGCKPEQLKWYRRKVAEKGADKTAQEYPSDPETCFLVSGRGFFDEPTTARLLADAPSGPLESRDRHRIRIYRKPQPNVVYLLSVDTSEGGGGDPSGAMMWDRRTGEHVATIDGQFQPWELAKCSAKLGREYNEAEIAVERNNHGHAVLQALDREEQYRNIYRHEDEKPGWPTNTLTRPQMLDGLEDAHRRGLFTTPDRAVLSQLRTFVTKNGKPQAANGEHDELVIAAAIGWAVRRLAPVRMPPRQPRAPTSRWHGAAGRGFG